MTHICNIIHSRHKTDPRQIRCLIKRLKIQKTKTMYDDQLKFSRTPVQWPGKSVDETNPVDARLLNIARWAKIFERRRSRGFLSSEVEFNNFAGVSAPLENNPTKRPRRTFRG